MPTQKKAAHDGGKNSPGDSTKPLVSGQCAQVLELIRTRQPVLSLTLTADLAIPEAAARVHDLRGLGFRILTEIIPEVVFRGAIRRRVARYSLASPEWAPPPFDLAGGEA